MTKTDKTLPVILKTYVLFLLFSHFLSYVFLVYFSEINSWFMGFALILLFKDTFHAFKNAQVIPDIYFLKFTFSSSE